jgi:hypothetical protein
MLATNNFSTWTTWKTPYLDVGDLDHAENKLLCCKEHPFPSSGCHLQSRYPAMIGHTVACSKVIA